MWNPHKIIKDFLSKLRENESQRLPLGCLLSKNELNFLYIQNGKIVNTGLKLGLKFVLRRGANAAFVRARSVCVIAPWQSSRGRFEPVTGQIWKSSKHMNCSPFNKLSSSSRMSPIRCLQLELWLNYWSTSKDIVSLQFVTYLPSTSSQFSNIFQSELGKTQNIKVVPLRLSFPTHQTWLHYEFPRSRYSIYAQTGCFGLCLCCDSNADFGDFHSSS